MVRRLCKLIKEDITLCNFKANMYDPFNVNEMFARKTCMACCTVIVSFNNKLIAGILFYRREI